MEPFGHTRSRVQRDHAMISPDTHVFVPHERGWTDTEIGVHISPRMGSEFWQYTLRCGAGATGTFGAGKQQRLVYVLSGAIDVESSGARHKLTDGMFAFLPSDADAKVETKTDAQLMVFEKTYVQLDGVPRPPMVVGDERDIDGEPFMGDPRAILKSLLPDDPAFDMAVNIFTFEIGARLPQVEVHIMEHGLLMLQGEGVYRLADSWYPVQAGDIIWMAPYCPQWFVAMGTDPARYLYYKDVNREPPVA